ncbi:unnamed protein product [Caenorhabditis auriculariae]|uniref:mitogen-activated protein kinase kinase n=1 Tax=Caenorhabditis auriculariae TaxID=2777116 RepID=A0A8S1GPF2_9PELO|nr:unnamed protein product [Caenorhabditis auriculariae]
MDHTCFQSRLRELENRIRKWKLLKLGFVETRLRERRDRRSSSTGRSVRNVEEEPSTKEVRSKISPLALGKLPDGIGLSSTSNGSSQLSTMHNRPLRPTHIGSMTTPIERKRPSLGLSMQPSPSRRDPELEAVERRFQDAKLESGRLRLLDKEINISMEDINYDEYRDRIGHGTCGTVYRVTYDTHIMAMKTMQKTPDKNVIKRILQDLAVTIRQMNSPFIVSHYGYIIDETSVRIFMEMMVKCCDRLLRRLVPEKRSFPERVAGRVAYSMIHALDYLKEKHEMIHRDIKPSNILFDWDGRVKLCDFGISGYLINSIARTGTAGCPPYMAPERLDPEHSSNYDVRSDVWSLGISIIQMVTGRYPYDYDPSKEINTLLRISDMQEPPPKLDTEDGFSENFVNFVDSCLVKDFQLRPKYQKLKYDPFILEHDPTSETYKISEEEPDVDEVAHWLRMVVKTTSPENEKIMLPHTPNPIKNDVVPDEKDENVFKNSGKLTIADVTYESVSIDQLKSELCGFLGSGVSGKVETRSFNGYKMAVKIMNSTSVPEEEKKRMIRELEALPICKEPFVVTYYGYIITRNLDQNTIYICMEMMAYSCQKLVELAKSLEITIPEIVLGRIACSVVRALSTLRAKHAIIHRDIKPSNILLDNDGRVKICDFGLSGNLTASKKAYSRDAGCPSYMAPERLQFGSAAPSSSKKPGMYDDNAYDERSDIWSLGISLHEAASLKLPFDNSFFGVAQKAPEPLALDRFSTNLSSFVQMCTIPEMENRAKYADLEKHDFFLEHDRPIENIGHEYDAVGRWLDELQERQSKRNFRSFPNTKF